MTKRSMVASRQPTGVASRPSTRADTEAPIGAAVNHALGRPEVDASSLAVFGISGGGYAV